MGGKKDLSRPKGEERKQPPISYDPQVFEEAFQLRLGQTPLEWVATKVENGSDWKAIPILFDISAAEIARRNHCVPQSFERYYIQYLKQKGQRSIKVKSVKKNYNKLVRDHIPEIIKASGKDCEIETLDTDHYIELLDKKLDEELAEYQESKSLEELADLLEVMGAVVKARGYTWEQLTAVRKKKHAERGGFDKKILLKAVQEYELGQPETTSEPEKRPTNAGKPWTEIEDDKLRDEFTSNESIGAIAKEHGRSYGAIRARLIKLGLISK